MRRFPVLVLNNDYQPLSVFPLHCISGPRAVRSVFNGFSDVVAEYSEYIGTPNLIMKWPSIIVRKEYLKMERIPILSRESLYYRDYRKCAYTGRELSLQEATIDHVIPRSKGGKHTWDNVVLSSPEANVAKADNLPVGKWEPRIKPYKPTYWNLLKIRKQSSIVVYHESWIDFIQPWEGEIIVKNPNT